MAYDIKFSVLKVGIYLIKNIMRPQDFAYLVLFSPENTRYEEFDWHFVSLFHQSKIQNMYFYIIFAHKFHVKDKTLYNKK